MGINNIPPKHCPYSCTYCQVGRTSAMGIRRRAFYQPETIVTEVRQRLEALSEPIDYLSFVPDGEPTLDRNLGRTIALLRPGKIPTAVITNAALIWRPDVQRDLAHADWVSLKVDTVDEETWHRINRPHRNLDLSTIMAGMLDFARGFYGRLVTETMLVEGVNDGEEQLRRIARFLNELKPVKAYLSIPTRPPAESGVSAPNEMALNRAHHILSETVTQVELLTGYEGNAFAASGNLEEDLLNTTAVHPLREDAVRELVARDHASWERVDELVRTNQLAAVDYRGDRYYTRKWSYPWYSKTP